MAHSHSHADSHLPKDNNARRLLFAFIVTAGFMLLEVVGGILSGSLALLADAGHMLTDAAALLFALLAVQFSRRPPTVRHTFGWLRLTTLAAFVNAIALVVITLLIVWEAIERFYTPRPVAGNLMMVLSIVAMILMTRKYVENWLLWVIINVISVVIFALQGVYAMSLEYLILTFIAVNGSRLWINSARERGSRALSR